MCVCFTQKHFYILLLVFLSTPTHRALRCAPLPCTYTHTHTHSKKKIKNLFSQSLFPRATERFWTTASANTSEPADCISMTDSARSLACCDRLNFQESKRISRTLSLSQLQLRPFARVSLCSLFVLCSSALCNYGSGVCDVWLLFLVLLFENFLFLSPFFVFVIFSSRSGFLADSSQVCYAAMIIINIL